MENIDNQQQINNKFPGPVEAGLFFSLASLLLTYGGRLLPFKNNYLRSGLGELIFILLPVVIFLLAGRYNIKDTLKLNKTKPVNYVIVVFLMIFAMPVVGILNALVLGSIRLLFGKNLPIPQIPIDNVPTLFIAILVIGIAAAVCEETLFRGLISKGYGRMGAGASLAVTSVLFGLLHRDIQKAVSTILLGAVIGFIVYRTKSIFAGMVAHFTNNTAAVLITYSAARLTDKMGDMGVGQVENFDFSSLPPISILIVFVFYTLLFLGALSFFTALFYALYRSTQKNFPSGVKLLEVNTIGDYSSEQFIQAPLKRFNPVTLLCAVPGVLIILFTFIGQFLQLLDVNGGIVYEALKAIRIL